MELSFKEINWNISQCDSFIKQDISMSKKEEKNFD